MSGLEKERGVSLLQPKNRGVFTVNFKHPLLMDNKKNGKSITKSLGAEIGKDYDKAREIVDEIKSIINNKECYGDFNGYLKCKRIYSKKAVDIVFDNTIFKNELYDDFKEDILDKYISLKSSSDNGKNLYLNEIWEYKDKKIQLIGKGSKSIKRILSQYIGSVKTSFLEENEKFNLGGSFEAHICKEAKGLEFICTFLSKEALVYELKKNLHYSIEALLLNERLNNKEGIYSNDETNEKIKLSIYRNLTEGKSGEFNLNPLFDAPRLDNNFVYIKEETNSLYNNELIEKVKFLARDSWIGFCDINKKVNFIYGDNRCELIKEAYYKFLTKEDKVFSERFNNIIEEIIKEIEEKRVNILKNFIKETKNLGKEVNWILKILDRECGEEVIFSSENGLYDKGKLCDGDVLYDKSGLCDEHVLCDNEELYYEDGLCGKEEKLSLNDLENISSMASVYFSLSYRKGEENLKEELESGFDGLELINKKPDKALRETFFRILECFSSSNEKLRGQTLKPLINGIRIKGNFKPLWMNESEIFENVILSYYEEELNNEKSISNEVRKNMVNVHRILWILEENENSVYNEEILKYLIINGYLNKSRLCFIEDESSKGYLENRKDRKYKEYKEDKVYDFIDYERVNSVKRKLECLLNYIGKEIGFADNFIRGREEIYKNKLINNVFLLNSLDKIIINREFAYKDEKRAVEEEKNIEVLINLGGEREDSNLKDILLSLKKSFEENKISVRETVRNLEELIINVEREKAVILECSKPSYKYEKLVYLGLSINKIFREKFIKLINSSNWQELESFNSKIVYNYKGRAEGELCPEYILECIIKENLLSYLLNPESLRKETNIEEFEDEAMSIMESLSGEILEGVKRLVVEDNLEAWEEGVNQIEEDNFISRRKNIENIINKNFYVDYELLKEDKVFFLIKEALINNKVFKELKGEIKI